MGRQLVLTAIAILVGLGSAAAVPAQRSPGFEERLKLAHRYVVASHRADLLKAAYLEQLKGYGDPCPDAECREALYASYASAIDKAMPDFVQEYEIQLAAAMTERELRAMTELYERPVGRSVAVKTAALSSLQARSASDFAKRVTQEIARTFCIERPKVCVPPASPGPR